VWFKVPASEGHMAVSGDIKPQTRPISSRPLVRRIAVADLMAGGREAVLLHDGVEYRLRLTSNGKLILTK
jgi:hemin uptake protein HemP